MKKLTIIIVFLSGCTPHMLYQPNVIGEHTEQYSTDVDNCKKDQFYDNYGHSVIQSLTAPGAVWERPEAYNQIDDCLRKKGYKVAN